MFKNTKIYPLWKFFTKLKLALFLILILAVITGFNTFYSNELPVEENLGTEIYHSWWYIALLLILFINILVCTLDRFYYKIKLNKNNKEIFIDKTSFNAYDFSYKLEKSKLNDSPLLKIFENLNKKRYIVTKKDNWIAAEKGKIRYWGSYLTHLGILVFIIGYIIGKIFGMLGTAQIYNDTSINSYYNWYEKKFENFDYQLHLENFDVIYYSPQVEIELVNNNSSGYDGEKTYKLYENESLKPDDIGYTIEFYKVVPDAIVKDDLVYQISKIANSVCFAFKIYKDNVFIRTHFLFRNNSFVNGIDDLGFHLKLKRFRLLEKEVTGDLVFLDKNNKEIKRDRISINKPVNFYNTMFYLTQYGQDAFKNPRIGLQIMNDPGLLIVWFSFALIFIGVIISFYIYHVKIIVLEDNDNILIAGTCKKNKLLVEKEISRIIKEV